MITDPNKIRVAIVDDEELARERMRTLLAEHNDIEVVAECADGAEALQKLTSFPADVIITDLNMPNLDGIGLITAARKLTGYTFVPILLLTTESQAAKKDEGRKAGATGWIVKPFNAEQLAAVLQKLLK